MHKIKVVNLCESNCLSLSIKKKKKNCLSLSIKTGCSMVYGLQVNSIKNHMT